MAQNDKTAAPVVDDINEEKVWFEWIVPERAFKKRDRDFWITALALLVLVGVILFLVKEFFLIIALCSILFLAYVMATVNPEKIKIKITNWGVYFGEKQYPWNILEKFWFNKNLDNDMINFQTKLKFPKVISMVINPEDKDKIEGLVKKKIQKVENSPTFIDKLTKWFADRLPLEDKSTAADKVKKA